MMADVRESLAKDQDKFVLRMPAGMRDRIKEVADRNNRSMNAEIVGTLELAYPPKSIDIGNLVDFLDSMIPEEDIGSDEHQRYIELVNDAMSKTKHPWTVRVGGLGEVEFLPYASPAAKVEDGED